VFVTVSQFYSSLIIVLLEWSSVRTRSTTVNFDYRCQSRMEVSKLVKHTSFTKVIVTAVKAL
jgi:hypothetical protein